MAVVRSNEELNKYAESKAPLTGTGASGTWGISVTGNAGTVTNGVYTTGDQTIAGVKTFSSSPIVPTPITGTQVANKDYVDASIALKTIATGTATFTATTNNINLTGIGLGVEVGDVIQISGADDAKNNSEFTIEVITDANNIIVNQAHANKGTTKNVATRAEDTGVTVKLLAKWYNAPIGLGRGWVNVTRVSGTNYPNNLNRDIEIFAFFGSTAPGQLNFAIKENTVTIQGGTPNAPAINYGFGVNGQISIGSIYSINAVSNCSIASVMEKR